MMKVVILMIREIENVYNEKPLIRSSEYKMGFSLFLFPFNTFPLAWVIKNVTIGDSK